MLVQDNLKANRLAYCTIFNQLITSQKTEVHWSAAIRSLTSEKIVAKGKIARNFSFFQFFYLESLFKFKFTNLILQQPGTDLFVIAADDIWKQSCQWKYCSIWAIFPVTTMFFRLKGCKTVIFEDHDIVWLKVFFEKSSAVTKWPQVMKT